MKKLIIIAVLLINISIAAFSQQASIIRQYELDLPGKSPAFYPVLNAVGDKLLYSSDAYTGLSLYDLKTNKNTIISTEAGAGYEPVFGNNDSHVFYHKTSFVNNRRLDAMESFDFGKSEKKLMLSPRRNLKLVKPYRNGFLVSTDKNILKVTFGKTAKENLNYVTTEDLKIILFNNDKLTVLNPLNVPESRYLWVSLSPDNQKILFTAAGKGTYVCDLNGKVVSKLGFLNAPVWYNDNFVVGMEDKDDGHIVISSKVVIVNIYSLQKLQISKVSEIAMYPTASAQGKIAYNTMTGKICLAEINIK